MSKLGTGLLRSAVALLFAATVLAQAPGSAKAPAKHASGAAKAVVWPAADMKWVDAPDAPAGVQQVVLWGDSTKGRFGTITKFPAGFSTPLHSHSANLKMVMISGTEIHGPEGKPEVRLSAGSYLFEPSGYKHTTACDKAAECVFFMEGDGKFDLVMAEKK
jgi:quercetin dioxygenase-like cupin family protein